MRSRLCNGCRKWSRVDEWGYGCPSCGNSNGRGEVSYREWPGVEIMPDIRPYQSMADGSIIGSRSTHREHLRRHNMIEVGNDSSLSKPHRIPDAAPQQRIDLIRAQFDAIDNRTFKEFMKRDIDRVKWQSRKD